MNGREVSIIDYASPRKPRQSRWRREELHRIAWLIGVLAFWTLVLVGYSWGGAAWAKSSTGLSALDSRFTGTDAYTYWLIDVPFLLGSLAPLLVAMVTLAQVMPGTWRTRMLLMLIACVLAWFVTSCAIVFISMDIDP